MKEKIYNKIAWFLPQRVVYWAFFRFWGSATTFEEGAKMSPNEMTWSKAIELWERKHQKKDYSSKCYCVCGHEILQDSKSKVYDAGSHVDIICSNCNAQTSWDLDAPAPLFLKEKTIL